MIHRLARLAVPALAAAICLGAGASGAATLVALPAAFDAGTVDADLAFNDLCAANGGGPFGCETALVQFRGGDGAGGGRAERELKLIDVVTVGGTARQAAAEETDFTHANGAARAFSITFDAAAKRLAVDFAGTTLSAPESLDGFETLVLRARAGTRGGVFVTDLVVNGVPVPDLSVGQGAADRRAYLALTGFDPSEPFAMTGNATFAFPAGGRRPNSAVIFEAKFTDVALAPVPLPAAGLLLLGALGCAAALRRRRG